MGRYDDRIQLNGQYGRGVKIGVGGGCIPLPFAGNTIDKIVMTVSGNPRSTHNQMLFGGCNDGSEYVGATHSTSDFYTGGRVSSVALSANADQTFDNTINEITISNLTFVAGYFNANYWGLGYYASTALNTDWYDYTLFDIKFYKNNILYAHYDFEDIGGSGNVTILDVSGNGRHATLYGYVSKYAVPLEVFAGFSPVPFKIRYIEIGSVGSNINGGNHIVELRAFDLNRTNVALNKPVTSNNTNNASFPWSRVTDGNTDTAIYADVGPATQIDLQAEYDISSIVLWRYYGDGRTYYQTYLKVYNNDKSKSAMLHDYSLQGTYAEDIYGRQFPGNHIALGQNGWGRDWRFLDLYVGVSGSVPKRITKYIQYTTTYGDKYTYNNSGGYLYLTDQRWFNINQNSFYFRSYVAKDSAEDRYIATFKNTTNTAGWSILWLADGRIRWEMRYNSVSTYSYSSNYLPATSQYYEIVIDFPNTGTGAGNMYWNGVWSAANRSGKHQMSANYLVMGTWGIYHRDYIRCKGIDSAGAYHDIYGYINNLTPGAGNHMAGSLGTINTSVYQDTSTSESWV